jgi:hypothetical protein
MKRKAYRYEPPDPTATPPEATMQTPDEYEARLRQAVAMGKRTTHRNVVIAKRLRRGPDGKP